MVAATAEALRNVGAFHMDGELTDEQGATMRIEVDVDGPRFHVQLANDAGTVEVVLIGDDAYLKGDSAALEQQLGTDATRLLAGRWLKVPADQIGTDATELVKEFSADELAYCLPRDLGTLTNLGTKALAGRNVVVVSDRGDKPGTAPGKLYVAAEGDPLPIRIEQTGPERPGGQADPRCDGDDSGPDFVSGDIRFSYGKAATVTPPADAVDIRELTGAGGLKT